MNKIMRKWDKNDHLKSFKKPDYTKKYFLFSKNFIPEKWPISGTFEF